MCSTRRYRCQGAGPALGALNGAVIASPSTEAGQPPERYTAATRSCAQAGPEAGPGAARDAEANLANAVHDAQQTLASRADLSLEPDEDVSVFTATAAHYQSTPTAPS